MKPNDEKPLKIHVEKGGSVWVDPKEFFAQKKVLDTIEKFKTMDIVGKTMDDATLFSEESSRNSADTPTD